MEWFNNIVINKDLSVFMSNDSLSETFNFAKNICLGKLPFAITEFKKENLDILEDLDAEKIESFDQIFSEKLLMKCWIFVAPSQATQLFHQWQRERRMWWRKFSASPGRYSLTDIKNNSNMQYVDIIAKYPWGDQLVEKIILNGCPKGLNTEDFQFRENKKLIEAKCITSEVSLSTMVINTLCDSYDEPTFHEKLRPLLRLHRKLAPYKLSFAITIGPKNIVDELKDLALYLCRQLRSNNVSCLYLPSSYKHTLESQWQQYDAMGIPYNVLLNENTLKNGILQLRSRDTTLKEQVHVANLVTYVEQLFKNY